METAKQDALYEKANAELGAAVSRLARAYEADPDKRADLRQDIHVALWRSFAGFNGLCSLKTWVYRVSHNVAVAHVVRSKRARGAGLVGIEDLDNEPADESADADRRMALERLVGMIQRLKPPDRQVMTLYLEGESAAAIGEVTGLSPAAVAQKVRRVKTLLGRRFREGGNHDGQTPSR